MWAAQCDYALGVFRYNWSLMLRILKQYREFDTVANVDNFFGEFIELDQSKFQIGPNARIQSLIQTNIFWDAYQSIFAFVSTSNDAIKAEFGLALKVMANIPNHENKVKFIKEAEIMSLEQDNSAVPLYEIVSHMFQLSELLAKSDCSIENMNDFSKREDVQSNILSIEKLLDKEDARA